MRLLPVLLLLTSAPVLAAPAPPVRDAVRELHRGRALAAVEAAEAGRAAGGLTEEEARVLSYVQGVALVQLGRSADALATFEAGAALGSPAGLASHRDHYWGQLLHGAGREAEALEVLERVPLPSRFGLDARALRVEALHAEGRSEEACFLAAETAGELRWDRRESQATLQVARCLEREALAAARAGDGSTARVRRAEAAGLYRTVVALWPRHSSAELARTAFDRLREREVKPAPPDVDDLLARSRWLAKKGHPRHSIGVLRSMRALLPASRPTAAHDEIDLLSAEVAFRLRRFRQSYRWLQRVVRGNRNPELVVRAEIGTARLIARHGYAAAIERLAEVASAHPDAEATAEALARAGELSRRHGDLAGAERYLRRCTEREPASDTSRRCAWALAWLGWTRGDLESARALLDGLLEAEEVAPTTADFRFGQRVAYWRGRTLENLGERDGAVAAYRRLAADHPFDYYGLMAWERLTALGEPAPAEPTAAPDGEVTHPEVLAARAYYDMGLKVEARLSLMTLRRESMEAPDRREAARLWEAFEELPRSHRMAPVRWDGGLPRVPLPEDPDVRLAYPRAFSEVVESELRDEHVPAALMYAVMRAESAFDPMARSPAGALGLTQVIRRTASRMAAQLNLSGFNYWQLQKPELAVQLGSHYLGHLLHLFGEHPALALAAYNAGEDAVARWLRKRGPSPIDVFIEEIPFDETNRYVRKVLSFYAVYRRLYDPDATAPLGIESTVPKVAVRRAREAFEDPSVLRTPRAVAKRPQRRARP